MTPTPCPSQDGNLILPTWEGQGAGKNMNAHIRNAVLNDAGGIASLIRGLGLFAEVAAEPLEKTVASIAAPLEDAELRTHYAVFVAEAGGEIVGFAALHILPYFIRNEAEGYISELFVRASARGGGIGAALLHAATEEARRRGCFRLRLLNVKQRESYQRRFYAKNGWKEWEDAATFLYDLA